MQHFNSRNSKVLMMAAALCALAACSSEQGYGAAFFKEAGSQVDSGANFGNATLHNQLVQTCRANGTGFGKAGGGAGDPVVVLDPASTPTRQVYRVHCDGNLDGKYAAIVYDSYLRSAPTGTDVQQADAE